MALYSSGGVFMNSSVAVPAGNPATFGFWFKCDALTGSSNALFSWAPATGFPGIAFYDSASGTLSMRVTDAAVGTTDTAISGLTAGVWYFMLIRCVGDANRRIEVFGANGFYFSGQNTRSVSAATWSVIALFTWWQAGISNGPGVGFQIAEWWMTNSDVQPDGAATDPALVITLAYRGPTWVSHVYKNLVDYRDFRRGYLAPTREGSLWRYGNSQINGFSADLTAGGLEIKPHVPLPAFYERPTGFLMQQPMLMG